MGYPMAGYISKAGHNVTVYNRTAAKADKWVAEYQRFKSQILLQRQQLVPILYLHVWEMMMIYREVTIGERWDI